MGLSLESRVSGLEKQNRFLKGAFALLVIAGVTIAAAEDRDGKYNGRQFNQAVVAAPNLTKSSLTLTSPNGKSFITLEAKNDISGVWIHRGLDKPMVAIYSDSRQGAVVGVYGDHTKTPLKAMDGALSAGNGSNEASLQSVDSEGRVNVKSLHRVLDGKPVPLPQ